MTDTEKTLAKWLWLSSAIIIGDQLTKIAAELWLTYYQPVSVIPGYFNLTLMYNTGAAFSFLADAGGWQRWLFTILAATISVYLLLWIKSIPYHQKRLAIALSMILGGAVGNLIDRLIYGHVIDFIQIHYQEHWYYPAFNIADSAITLGALLLIVDILMQKKDNDESVSAPSDSS